MIACCGIDCSKCEGYTATLEDDDVKRADVAKKWSELFKKEIKPEHINCRDARPTASNSIIASTCAKYANARCRGTFGTCAECGDYICDTLAGFIKMAPEAGEALERLRG